MPTSHRSSPLHRPARSAPIGAVRRSRYRLLAPWHRCATRSSSVASPTSRARGSARGCNAVFAPPCDVAVTPNADAFGTGATVVASAATEWIDAAQAEGVLCFAGMFPGAGRIARTAFDMPTVRNGDDSLYATDLVPFRAAIDAGVAGFTIANARYTALDPTGTPAPLSRPILRTLLRGNSASMASRSPMPARLPRKCEHGSPPPILSPRVSISSCAPQMWTSSFAR